jgi:molecular chaperone HscA
MLLQLTEPGMTSLPHAEDVHKAIGIDLGTTNSVVAYSENGQPIVIKTLKGVSLIPSVVSYNKGVTVGVEALDQLKQDPKNAVSSVKRFMATPSKSVYQEKTPVEISADILSFLKAQAEQALGQSVTHAVITVPAYFDDTARQATKDAAKIAGLTVLRLINEPTAAALAYGLDQGVEGIYAIYDFGGGTFDISLLKLTQGVFQVLATGGDTNLGGDDIDEQIVNHWFGPSESWRQHQLTARQAKEVLSEHETWSDGQLHLDRETLESLSLPLIEKTTKICHQVLLDANLMPDDIKGVVMVGGSTRMPLVRSRVADFFKTDPLIDMNPDEIVALGAALQAEGLTRGSNTLLLDVIPLSLGIETMGGIVEKIIPRNTPIPITLAQEFTTYQDGQTALKVHVLQGERELVDHCRSLGEFILSGIPSMVAGAARVEITFAVDADGLLTVSAQEKMTGVSQQVEVKPSYGLTEDDLIRMLKDNSERGAADMQQRLLVEAKVDAERLVISLESALKADSYLLQPEEIAILRQELEELKEISKTNDRDQIELASKKLSENSQNFAAMRLNSSIYQQLVGKTI